MNAVLAHIDVTDRLEVLSLCGQCRRDANWPSWVANYGQQRRYGEIFESYFAAGYSRAHVQYVYPNMLEVVGTQVDIVDSCSMEFLHDTTDACNHIRA